MGTTLRETWLPVAAILLAQPTSASAAPSPYGTTADFVSLCDGASPSEDCQNALMHVEQIVNFGDHPNDTCDGGPDEILKARSNEELAAKLTERVVAVVAWLKLHPEYSNLSYGDGIWAALKGVYCR